MMKEVKAVRDSAIKSYVSTLTTQELKDFAEMCTGSDWDLYSSASKTRCGFMTFQLPEKNSLGVSDKAYLYRIKVPYPI